MGTDIPFQLLAIFWGAKYNEYSTVSVLSFEFLVRNGNTSFKVKLRRLGCILCVQIRILFLAFKQKSRFWWWAKKAILTRLCNIWSLLILSILIIIPEVKDSYCIFPTCLTYKRFHLLEIDLYQWIPFERRE